MTYTVSKYDVGDHIGEEGDWATVATGVTKWGLRAILRELYRRGYSNVSVAVDAEFSLDQFASGDKMIGPPQPEGITPSPDQADLTQRPYAPAGHA